ncbi:MAG: OmpA family protein [Chitinophagales bacterium]
MKNTILLLFIALSTLLNAQDTATVIVKVQDENLKPIIGEQIIFEDKNKSYKTSNASGEDGTMEIKLLGGKTYNISIKTIGEAQEYNTLEIPPLAPNTKYGVNELTITIYESKTFTLDNVYFDSGKSTLKKESFTELNELFEYLSLKKTIKIEIAGHTDNVGNDAANMTLSQNRADAVKNYLVKKGIASNRIETKAYGETQPVMSNESAEGRAKNRRIEVNVK